MTRPIPMITANPAADEERRPGLRRMRTSRRRPAGPSPPPSTSLTLDQDGFLGFVNAGAEASMVGAIADWFAVTALFKHPLGLPIPHTALVPRRKDELGRGLEEFFGENFLQEAIIRDRVGCRDDLDAPGGVAQRAGATPAGWSTRWPTSPSIALGRVRDEHIAELVEAVLVPRFREEPIAPAARAPSSSRWCATTSTTGWSTWPWRSCTAGSMQNPDTFAEVLSERAPWWAPPRLNEAVTSRVHTEAVRWLDDIRNDPHHHAREALDSMLAQLGQDLLFDEDTQARAEALKLRLLDHPQFSATGISLWNALRRALLGALRDPRGPLRERLETELTAFADRLTTDDAPARAPRRARRRRDRLRRRAVRRRAHGGHHPHHRALGRQGGGAPDRAARGSRPAVHPDQRHHRRWPGRRWSSTPPWSVILG